MPDTATLAEQALGYFFDTVGDASALLGDRQFRTRAIEATRLSTLPLGTSTVFVEFPLAGAPAFDLHVYPEIAHEEKRNPQDEEQLSALWPQYRELMGWCAQYPAGVAEAGYAFDLSSNPGALDEPCLYTAFFERDKTAVIPSMGLMGGPQFEPALRRIVDALPTRTRIYYTGVMHGRNPIVAHVGYKVGPSLAQDYAESPDLLDLDLQKLGFAPQGFNPADFESLARFGIIRDIQFAFDERGIVEGTLAFSFVGREGSPLERVKSFRGGEQREVLEFLETLGLADGRWRQLDSAVGVRRVPVYAQGKVRMAAVAITVGYVKVSLVGGELRAPAKMYLSVKSVALTGKGER